MKLMAFWTIPLLLLVDDRVQGELINKQIVRTFLLASPTLNEEVRLTILNDSAKDINAYHLTIPAPQSSNLAKIQANQDGKEEALTIIENKTCPLGSRCLLIDLQSPLKSNDEQVIIFSFTWVNAIQAHPQFAKQGDPMKMKMEIPISWYNPGVPKMQVVNIITIADFQVKSISCPTPFEDQPTLEHAASNMFPGSSLYRCGPFENQNFREMGSENQIRIDFTSSQTPFYSVDRLERIIEYSPLRSKFHVTQVATIRHLGYSLLNSEYSRYQQHTIPPSAAYIRSMHIPVPASAENLKFSDDLGLLTTPYKRSPLSQVSQSVHLVEYIPRSPLAYSWTFNSKISYEIPSNKVLKDGKFGYSLWDEVSNVSVREYTFRLSVPAHIKLTEYVVPAVNLINFQSSVRKIEFGLFWEPHTVYKLNYKNLVIGHDLAFVVGFEEKWWNNFKHPLIMFVPTVLAIFFTKWIVSNLSGTKKVSK